MEQRIPLSQGETVKQFVIDRVIGFGASCLVYEAHYLDSSNHRKEVILKECYPCNAGASRIGNKIIWSNAEELEKAFLRFDNAYEIAAKIQNVAGTKSVSAYSLDKLTENGTQYVATIPNGTSYDRNGSTDIADIIRTALALTNAVGLYHKAGYLHLDIKPSNFIATEDQTGKGKNIVLFDVDTVVSQDDIQGGNLRSVSYSKECAAPEQKMQQIKKLCPATDLFAVGAVLFERIMNRPVDSSDSTLFATWDYDSRFDAKKVNPKAKRLLTEIFHKTLAANVKRRYQSADELAEALGELRDVIDSPSPYIYSYPVETNCTFVGRNSELSEIHKGLTINNRVFVKGAGGIGKTELVRKYVSIYQDKYDAVVFMMYNGSVSECLNDIKPIGVDSKDRDNKALLKEICDNDKILLILDNYDVAPNESADLNELFELNCKVIVTTRTDFSERNPNSYFVEVSGLSAEVLKRIFENGISRELSDSEFDALKPILHIGQECTYFWSMAARLANEGAYTISEIVEKVSLGLDDLDESEDIFDTKDGKNINTTVAKAMLVLFKLDELTDKEFDVLKAMYFLDCLNLDKRQVKEILSFSEKKLMNAFNALVKKGYIEKINVASREVYRISDVLRNVLEYKVEPDISNTKIVTLFIEEKLFVNKEMLTGLNKCTRPFKDRVNYILICMFKVFSVMNWNIIGNALYCVEKMYSLFAGESHLFYYTYRSSVIKVLNNVVDCIERVDIFPISRIKCCTLLIAWSCFLFDTDSAEKLFWLVISEIENNNIEDTEVLDYICKPIVCVCDGDFQNNTLFSSNLINKIRAINPPCFHFENNLNIALSENSTITYDEEMDINFDKSMVINYPSLITENGDYSIDLFLSSLDTFYSQDYVYYYISEFSDMLSYHFDFKKADKNKYIAVATRLEKMLNEFGVGGKQTIIHGSYYASVDNNEADAKLYLSLAIMYKAFFNYDTAYNYLNLLFECLKRYLNKLSMDDLIAAKDIRIRDYLFCVNRNLNGQLVVPLMFDFIKAIRECFSITNESDETMYSYYKALVKAAERAHKECEADGFIRFSVPVSESDPRSMLTTKEDYEALIEKYTDLIRKISGQEYHP